MTLSAKKSKQTSSKPRLKLFIYGEWKIGKTTAALQFPKPYFIDTENGAAHSKYQELIAASAGDRTHLTTYEEIVEDVAQLATTNHEYYTLVIDSLSTIYGNMLDRAAMKLAKDENDSGTEFGRHKELPDRKIKRLFDSLLKLDMNVIITSRSKTKWEKAGGDFKEAGNTFDCFKNSPYEFDLILEITKQGSKRIAVVKGSRLKYFGENELFEFSYVEIKKRYEEEYGAGSLEKVIEPVELISDEDAEQLDQLFSLLKEGEELKTKILNKAKIEKIKELTKEQAKSSIKFLNDKLNVKTEGDN